MSSGKQTYANYTTWPHILHIIRFINETYLLKDFEIKKMSLIKLVKQAELFSKHKHQYKDYITKVPLFHDERNKRF